MRSTSSPILVAFAVLAVSALGCKPRQGSDLNEISSGTSGSGDGQKNCEELLYEIERYQPKFNEAFEDYVGTQCEMAALSTSTQDKAKVVTAISTPTPKNPAGDNGSMDIGHMRLAGEGDDLESVGMKPDPNYVRLAETGDEAKAAKCKGLKKYLEERTVQLGSLKSEAGSKCSPQRIKAYKQGKREYIIVDHPTCGYFSRCDDVFAETNGVSCSRCWLDTYQTHFLNQANDADTAAKYKNFSSLTCSNEGAARDAVELFCNNIKPGSCTGPSDPKIKCEPVKSRDYNYEGNKTISGGLYKDWEGTEQSYSFATKFDTKFDNALTAGSTADGKFVEVSIKGKAGMAVTTNRTWNMALKVKSEVGLLTMSPPAMITRNGVEEGALNTKFSCGIEVMESSIDSSKEGVTTYVDVSVDAKAKISDLTGITNSEVSVGTSSSAGVSGGFDNVSSSGINKYKAFQSLYLTGAGMTKEGMQAACDRYNAQNMHLILSQFLSSAYAKFSVWTPKDDYCRTDNDCHSGNGWIGRCGVQKGATVGKCYLTAGHGMSCPTQTFSNRPCDRTLGCKVVRYMTFAGWKFNRDFECRTCTQGKDSEGFCKENP